MITIAPDFQLYTYACKYCHTVYQASQGHVICPFCGNSDNYFKFPSAPERARITITGPDCEEMVREFHRVTREFAFTINKTEYKVTDCEFQYTNIGKPEITIIGFMTIGVQDE